jgi:hypothetical protein
MIIQLLSLQRYDLTKVLPVIIRSGREFANALSTKKYSCSIPVAVLSLHFIKNIYILVAASSITCKARNKGVL